MLLPKRLAVIATPEVIAKLKKEASESRAQKEIQSDLFKKNLRAVKGMEVTISVKANEQGHLFKAVHEKDIVVALNKTHGVRIAPEYIHLKEPIKKIGTFTATAEAMGLTEEITIVIENDTK